MYIISQYLLTPNNDHTSATKFFEDPQNFAIDEVIVLAKRIRMKDLQRANLILDLTKKEVVKCRKYYKDTKLVKDPTYQEMFEYMKSLYPRQVEEALKHSTPSEL